MIARCVQAKFVKLLEEENIFKILFRKRSFKWDFIKIKSFLLFKDTIKKLKSTDREKIFTIHLAKKGLLFGICKELLETNDKNTNHPIKKNGQKLEHSKKKDIRLANMYMKRCLTSRKCKLKPEDILNPLKLLKFKILTPLNAGEWLKLSYLAGGTIKAYIVWQCIVKLYMHLHFNLAIPLKVFIQEKRKQMTTKELEHKYW